MHREIRVNWKMENLQVETEKTWIKINTGFEKIADT